MLNGKCDTKCTSGYYPDDNTRTCLKCDDSCLECDGGEPNQCTKCDSPNILDSKTCVSQCPEGKTVD